MFMPSGAVMQALGVLCTGLLQGMGTAWGRERQRAGNTENTVTALVVFSQYASSGVHTSATTCSCGAALPTQSARESSRHDSLSISR